MDFKIQGMVVPCAVVVAFNAFAEGLVVTTPCCDCISAGSERICDRSPLVGSDVEDKVVYVGFY